MSGRKPLGGKSYGSIPHLPGSRLGPKDYSLSEGQASILTEATRDRHDRVIVTEKLDGSNVGAANIDGRIVAITRAGYLASTSPYAQHHAWGAWVEANTGRFLAVLEPGERLCGEWLMVAHGTRYDLPHEPFVAFDLMRGKKRALYDEFTRRAAAGGFVTPHLIHDGGALSIEHALLLLGERGHHGALEPVEGAVWRVERHRLVNGSHTGGRRWHVDFLAKFVRHDKQDGKYLTGVGENTEDVLNTWVSQ